MKKFNTTGRCIPGMHYMVDITNKVDRITEMVQDGSYFCINRGRQYGKTTLLGVLAERLQKDYYAFSISFEGLSTNSFLTSAALYKTFFRLLEQELEFSADKLSDEAQKVIFDLSSQSEISDTAFIQGLMNINRLNDRPIVIIIDEVDQAGNYDSFIKFLGALRKLYLRRDKVPAFKSVILAGVYDVKNLKLKIRDGEEHQYNSPWNIAVSFDIDLSFSREDIMTMLQDYESEHHSGMNISYMAGLMYEYTAGYPFLVSRLCQLIDKSESGWHKSSFLAAERELLQEKNTLFDDMVKKLNEFPELYAILYDILFKGHEVIFNRYDQAIDIALMFDYIRNNGGQVAVANRIFEVWLYNLFMFNDRAKEPVYVASVDDKPMFYKDGRLDMSVILQRFIAVFQNLYTSRDEKFDENEGRKKFLLFLKPIINGTGNYYTESTTRNNRRTDVVVDYKGEQFIIELKIWRGGKYHAEGEQQLTDYMDYLGLDTGYMLIFNFNQEKQSGLWEKVINGKRIVEAFV